MGNGGCRCWHGWFAKLKEAVVVEVVLVEWSLEVCGKAGINGSYQMCHAERHVFIAPTGRIICEI